MDGSHAALPAHGHADHGDDTTVFGFWLYLMTDCVVFAALFGVFAVMRNQFAGGPTPAQIFELPNVGIETAILLVSSITYGFGMLAAHAQNMSRFRAWMVLTFILGFAFVFLEVKEFSHLIEIGAGPDRSAFLSSFFTLVATHGIHVTVGLIWMAVLLVQSLGANSFSSKAITRLTCLSLFWHFLDIVWVCVFSFVYLMSVA
jgi:cytochrome o ubiquinol oxidase subunit 3